MPPELSVLIPALNEARTIRGVVDRVLALPLDLQVIVVDDGSTDETPAILAEYGDRITVLRNERPGGKGNAIRKALPATEGRVSIVQDADLEYRPEEIPALVRPILDGKAGVVFGTRFAEGYPKGMALPNKIVNWLLALSVRALFRQRLTDEATCYKAVRTDLLQGMDLQCERFEFCPEVTAKAIRSGETILEVPISYAPRSKSEGKKIRWTDAPEAFTTLWRYRNWNRAQSPARVVAIEGE
ncbi:glycosyltransferase family 2 protein [bacterium]|nr:MAG: glycosyltransferase family 2 protein [bacterium]